MMIYIRIENNLHMYTYVIYIYIPRSFISPLGPWEPVVLPIFGPGPWGVRLLQPDLHIFGPLGGERMDHQEFETYGSWMMLDVLWFFRSIWRNSDVVGHMLFISIYIYLYLFIHSSPLPKLTTLEHHSSQILCHHYLSKPPHFHHGCMVLVPSAKLI